MAATEEFLAAYANFKCAFENTMSAVNNLIDDSKLQTNKKWETCLRMIDETFEMPLNVPINMEVVQNEWSNLCFMVERLAVVREDILKKQQPKMQLPTLSAGLFMKGLFGTVIFAASTAVLGILAPNTAGWFGRKIASTSIYVGKLVAPQGLKLLDKSIQYINPKQKQQNQTALACNNLESLSNIAIGSLQTIKTGYDLLQKKAKKSNNII